jgi:adenosylhomocysteinase
MKNVANIKLAAQGRKNIAWARSQMGALLTVEDEFKKKQPLKGYVVGMALHVTKETAVLVDVLEAGGAEVVITGCNPLSTQDDVAVALHERGTKVWAWKGETHQEYYANLEAVVAELKKAVKQGKKALTIDDGCDLVTLIHQKHTDFIPSIVGGTEETTTGVQRLRAMEADDALKYPVVAVNDNKTKHLFDNYYGTGQSTIGGLLRATNLLFAGKTMVVIGYGSCGRGVSLRAKGMSAEVVVCEVDNLRALQARMDGFRVMPILEAAKVGDVFVTVTGNKHVIDGVHMKVMKDGTILANSGHFDAEINIDALKKLARKVTQVRPSLQEFKITDGSKEKNLYLAGEGRLVNLAAAEGHPSTVMSLSFCGQALALQYIVEHKHELQPGVVVLPGKVDDDIAARQLTAMGIKKDSLTKEQARYLTSWQAGT